ncbi:MAG: FAD-dependent oxidoreductase [Streptococcaceae bacterium]|nr:FAD-dependent oxidoreductase [Streptococcaceae bacterium]
MRKMKVIIIGGSHAGIACARRAKEEFPDAQITIYEKQKEISFISQSIPLYLMGHNDILKNGGYTTIKELEAQGIQVKAQSVVRNIDTLTKQIFFTQEESNNVETATYDKLVLATGSYPLLPMFSGEFKERLIVVKNIEDAKRIRYLFETAKRIIVVGGGFIGVELSRILASHGIKITLIQAHSYLLDKYLDEPAARNIEALMQSEGIDIQLSTFPVDIREEENKETGTALNLYTDHYEKFEADAIIYSVGFRPNSFLLANQVELGDMGAIEVDDYMQTSHQDVFAVGDCATSKVNRVKGRRYLPHASEAIRQGGIAAINLAGPKQKIIPSEGTYSMNLDGRTLCATGLNKKNAEAEGFECGMVHYRNDFLNSDEYTNIWLVYERKTHKILGVQVEGTAEGIAIYADLISLAIQQNLAIEDVEFSDFYFKHGYKNPNGMIKTLAQLIRQEDPKS